MKRRLNTLIRIIRTGLTNFIRNFALAAAAMAVMVVTLTIVLSSVVTNATFTNTIAQITDKVDLSVYLKDDVTPQQVEGLISGLKNQPNTKAVKYLNKQQALERFLSQNTGNKDILGAVSLTSNPIPPTILVKPRDLNKIQDIKTYLSQPSYLALQSDPPSYNGDRKKAIDNIAHSTEVLRQIGIASVAIFSIICALIIFNTIQMAIFNRRDEITIMRLLGAKTSYIRGPYIVESIIYGIVAAMISILIIHSVFVVASNGLQASSLGLLDINYASTWFNMYFWQLLGIQLMVGILIGTVSSTIATRRYLKFKTK